MNVMTGKDGDIVVAGTNYNSVIKQARVTDSLTTNKRFTATNRKAVETVLSNFSVTGSLMVALVDPTLWNLRRSLTPFDILITLKNSVGDELDVRIINCRANGDSEIAVEEEVEDGIHFEFPFEAEDIKLL